MESNIDAVFQIIVKSGQMFYKNKILSFSSEDLDSFVENLPDEWWHPKDKILYFTYYSDGSYFCEREKTVYDYSLKTETTRVYEFNSLSDSSAKVVFLKFSEFFEKLRIQELISQKEILRQEIQSNFDFISVQYRNLRDMMLKGSDWIFLSDVSSKRSADEMTMWEAYRQFLRDMPQSDAWINRRYVDIVFPLDPDKFMETFPGEEYLSSSSHFENVTTLKTKEMIYEIIRTLKMPSMDQSILESDVNSQESISLLIDMINGKLSQIDDNIKVEIQIKSDI